MILCMGISEKIEVATVAINEAMILKVKETIAIAIPIKSDNVNLSCQKVCFLRRCLHLARYHNSWYATISHEKPTIW